MLRFRWIVNEYGEIGVRINDVNYYGYKGESLVYDISSPEHPKWRYIGKREFGESISGPGVPDRDDILALVAWNANFEWYDQ